MSGLRNKSAINSGSTSTVGIAIGWTSPTKNITGLLIDGNTIVNITASRSAWETITRGEGAYGIMIAHNTIGLKILDNTISNLKGFWAHAIGLEGKSPSALIYSKCYCRWKYYQQST